ncbi:hypothetical protein KKF82_05420 [Patescibacteria group bacterium]|nr:hypothetical protein [Patescibacteria group bacterium]
MKDIQLRELPKSKEFIKQAKIADSLTKETGLEHGFTFCKPNNEIIVDKMCIGTECNIDISEITCGKYDNFFHTHPNRKESEPSPTDLHNATYKSYFSNKPNIVCIKAENDEYVLCEKIDGRNLDTIMYIQNIVKEFQKEKTYFNAKKTTSLIHSKTLLGNIIFDLKKWNKNI